MPPTFTRTDRIVPAMQLTEDWNLDHSDQELIEEAIYSGLGGDANDGTLNKYRKHLEHFSGFLASRGRNFYKARRKDVSIYINHLGTRGGTDPDPMRLGCDWCADHGYPDGRKGPGWSPSSQKSHLSAIHYLYKHFALDEELPDINPSLYVSSPKVVNEPGYAPSREEVKALLRAPGRPRDRLLAFWIFYTASRSAPFWKARWRDLDLDAQHPSWDIIGKGQIADRIPLHPLLVGELKRYRSWQGREAGKNEAIEAALANSETAFVLLTRNGNPLHENEIGKLLKWRAIRAGVGVERAKDGARDAPGGLTSRVCPHALRRAWARISLDDGVPLDVIQTVLNHQDISTTRRHYAPGKPEPAEKAVRKMRL